MKAGETKLLQMFWGKVQFRVPLFQRKYEWKKKNWEDLWDDIQSLYNGQMKNDHFMGSIVVWPSESTADKGVKFTLIDGQQRLVTISILLALLRDKAKEISNDKLWKEIEEEYLINRFLEGIDRYKVLPTHLDRNDFFHIMDGRAMEENGLLGEAFFFFKRKLEIGDENGEEFDISRLWGVLSSKLVCVGITLSEDDNPYLIFETLNAKGLPLTQADLIRNLIFMKVPFGQQEDTYTNLWKPMEENLGEWLTDFFWHYLMKDGDLIPTRDIYRYAKGIIEKRLTKGENIVSILKEITIYANYYHKLLAPHLEPSKELGKRIKRLNDWWVGTAFPFLLNLYKDYDTGTLSLSDFCQIIETIESFVVRREVCGVPSRPLNRIFVNLYKSIQNKSKKNGNAKTFIQLLEETLKSHNWPTDEEFKEGFKKYKAYEASVQRCKLLLEHFERSYGHPEPVDFNNLEIEHVMPQTLTDWWKAHLGKDWETIYEKYLHTIGNLTLVAAPKNPELSNLPFPQKKEWFAKSHLELSKYIAQMWDNWTQKEIIDRATHLGQKAIEIWKRPP
jgi:uncharacterized protein with ParB-like and HNH nuclease domain